LIVTENSLILLGTEYGGGKTLMCSIVHVTSISDRSMGTTKS